MSMPPVVRARADGLLLPSYAPSFIHKIGPDPRYYPIRIGKNNIPTTHISHYHRKLLTKILFFRYA